MDRALLFCLASITLWAPQHQEMPVPRCPGITAEDVWDQLASTLEGSYRIEFVGTQGLGEGQRTRGQLTLWRRPDSMRVFPDLVGNPMPWMLEPVFGSATIDLEAVGAYVEGTLNSADPNAPGVLVREEMRQDSLPRLRLRLGSGGNQRGVFPLDGPFVDNEITVVGMSGFAGWWHATWGYTDYNAVGYFCARKITGTGGLGIR